MRGRRVAQTVQQCVACGDDYTVPTMHAKRYSTCSPLCSLARRSAQGSGHTWVSCETCGEEMYVKVARLERGLHRFCSESCRVVAFARLPGRRGSRKRYFEPTGYVRVIDWSSGRRRFIMEHRLIMEQVIGRPLTRAERVHHINGDRADNRPSNLRLYPTQAAHIKAEHPELATLASHARWPQELPVGPGVPV